MRLRSVAVDAGARRCLHGVFQKLLRGVDHGSCEFGPPRGAFGVVGREEPTFERRKELAVDCVVEAAEVGRRVRSAAAGLLLPAVCGHGDAPCQRLGDFADLFDLRVANVRELVALVVSPQRVGRFAFKDDVVAFVVPVGLALAGGHAAGDQPPASGSRCFHFQARRQAEGLAVDEQFRQAVVPKPGS